MCWIILIVLETGCGIATFGRACESVSRALTGEENPTLNVAGVFSRANVLNIEKKVS